MREFPTIVALQEYAARNGVLYVGDWTAALVQEVVDHDRRVARRGQAVERKKRSRCRQRV
jgi:hypothetical protein